MIQGGAVKREYTGYKSKKGYEICEGDVLEIGIDAPVVVFWDTVFQDGWLVAGGWLSGDGLEYYNERSVIIGNKYENPELLKLTYG